MDKLDILAGVAEETKVASGPSSAQAIAPAPGVGKQLIITGFSASFGAAPGASGFLDIGRSPTGVVRGYLLPVGVTIAPIVYEFKRPIYCAENEAAFAQVTGSTGAGVVVEVYTCTRPFNGVVTPVRVLN